MPKEKSELVKEALMEEIIRADKVVIERLEAMVKLLAQLQTETVDFYTARYRSEFLHKRLEEKRYVHD